MPTVTLLRGVNVGGNRKVPMAALKAVAQSLGLTKVQTYIQSGNLVFEGETNRADLEAALEREFGFSVAVTLRSAEAWQAVIARNPYPEQAEADSSKVHVSSLDAIPQEAGLAALRAVANGAEEWTDEWTRMTASSSTSAPPAAWAAASSMPTSSKSARRPATGARY